ncbi:MAG TPA: phosphoribosylamine--glycine ligase [Flavobacteriales bacterium]|nr:phosphoribosylamine--glycine ligase [Flavobacteriales bacterium]HCA83081.1 phosphoribosylamine--glycine ligase [Flavobacteriales bacterium]HRE73752.1 phosphoribosylamine--glycine ligase [Flavobacteriales bacterium]HRE95648.1 phosphoribosylamine--glycine ligase [Flavobacteriales bacterium]HRJ34537.1 phosphoribosylamine--glycine ligase [Flavobacteriales bacterium]
MNVLLLGSGGREHALAWKIAQSSQLEQLFVAPGNAGTSDVATNVNISPTDFKAIRKFVLENKITMVVVGPEDPLVKGIHDFFLADEELKKIPVIGPQKIAAQLEGSKDFAKAFMQRHGIPTARYQTFSKDTVAEAEAFLDTLKPPYVLKADGLAAGKGVLILKDLKEAKKEIRSMLTDAKFGEASSKVVIEEFLNGIEVSVFVLTDGKSYKILPEAKDYKRIGEGDTGLNTGGMGAVSPVPFADRDFMDKVENRVIIPTVKGLQQESIPYKGFIFFGLISVKGEPYVIEYNCRLGDPETEVVIPRIKSDILDLFEGVASETLSERDVQFDEKTAVTIMLVSGGYPGDYDKGKTIRGTEGITDSLVFHAGTSEKGGKVVTNGGRVIAVTSYGKDIESAVERSLKNADVIDYDKKYFRRDIGKDLMKMPQQV